MADVTVALDKVSKRFPPAEKGEGEHAALSEVTLEVEKGELLVVVGPSGCGKSTVGRLVLRLIEPTSGALWFAGRDVTHIDQRARRALARSGPVPTLIEWDNDVPGYGAVVAEVALARAMAERHGIETLDLTGDILQELLDPATIARPHTGYALDLHQSALLQLAMIRELVRTPEDLEHALARFLQPETAAA